MPAWVIPQAPGAEPQHQAHWFPTHTLAAALLAHEKTNCNLHVEQLVLGTPVQQAGPPPDTGGQLCYACWLRPRGV